ncbi:MAG: glycosyltransferase [Candidatus Kerfeldbacteria bacterium]|nr:glycosyltransferase [Candidatus Kerfeldbacteria bacterium]
MRILMLNSEYPPVGGGAATATAELLRTFTHHDLTVDLVTAAADDRAVDEAVSERIVVHRVPIGQGPTSYHRQSTGHIIRYYRAGREKVAELLRGKTYDLIHAFFTVPAGRIAYEHRRELPYLVSLRGSDVPGFSAKHRLATTVLRPMIRSIWRHAAAVVANSEGLRTLALRTAPQQPIIVIPNGVDADRFSPRDARTVNGPLRLLTVARLTPRKRIDDLLRAIVAKPEWTLTVVGDGEGRAHLASLSHRLGVHGRTTFTGGVPRASLPAIYRSHDVYVLPSSNEGMSNTILEAMASGVPIVTTDTGGARELVHLENGRIVPVGNVKALMDAIAVYEDAATRTAAAQASRERALDLSWNVVARAYEEQYRRISQPR